MRKQLLSFCISSLLIGCATYAPQTKEQKSITTTLGENPVSVYIIGDAGMLHNGKPSEALTHLEQNITNADTNDILLFMGDNVYPAGIPDEKKERKEAEYTLEVQLEVAKKFPGKVWFLPGNHDWYSGLKGLKRQEELVEDALGKDTFLPENGCPIKKININDDIVLLIVDSQWYITNWDNHPTINDNCEIKTRNQFLDEFRGEIKKARGKTTLVAIHHPMFSNGPHGGKYSFKDNLKPAPILGSLKNLIRKTSGIVNADVSNTFYNDLKKNLVAAAQQNDKVIFISGHDHNLQYLVEDNLPQIISGSGAKVTPTKNSGGGQFSYGALGYAILDIYKNSTANVRFIAAESNTIAFQTEVQKADNKSIKTNFPIVTQDSIKETIYLSETTEKGSVYRFFWGDRYRKYYGTPVTAKVVYLDTLFGGLTPTRKGGGTQSKALQFTNPEGKRYVIRAMKKQAAQFIQAAVFQDQYIEGEFKNTASEELVTDVFSGSYPFAPFTMGTLSNAIDLAHLNSKLYYIPKQESLGDFNDEFGDELYLFEEHASDGHEELAGENFTGDIISTLDMMKEIQKDESKVIDQKEFVKARLFDMLVGDSDRHQDQWRWIEYKENGKTIYRPLPRDRDIPFNKMSDGLLFGAAVKLIPAARKFRKYEADLKDVKGFNVSPYPLDIAFTNRCDKSVWDEQVRYIQSHITNEVIDEAFKNIPIEAQDESVEIIKNTLKQRRENLQKISDRYYTLLTKYAVLTATNKDDFIKVIAKEDGSVTVTMARKKDKTVKNEMHNRTYYPQNTKEIWIYGLDDDDTFEVIGKSKTIKIRLIGGQNNDNFIVENGKNVVIYDYKSKKNDVSEAQKAHLKLRDDYNSNVYDYKKLRNNVNQILPIIGANPDDGLKLGFTDTYTTYGFERNPFTSQHQLHAAFYFATNGYELAYKGEFANVIGNLNLMIQSKFNSPNFSLNFFGYGNETENFDDDLGLNFNRVKVREISFAPSLIWRANGGSQIHFGLDYENIEIHATPDRFVSNDALPEHLFEENQFVSTNLKYHFKNTDNNAYPTMGLYTTMEVGFKQSLDESDKNFVYFTPEVGFTHKLNASGRLVWATKVKSHLIFNDHYEFFQAASIGGTDGLRGFRNQRFTGQQSLYQNTDLRYSFSQMKTQLIPIKLGFYGGFDYGRVWYNEQDSNKWHNSYGGGFFLNGVDVVNANLGVFNSSDGIRIAFGLGFGF